MNAASKKALLAMTELVFFYSVISTSSCAFSSR